MHEVKIIKTGMIRSEDDITELGFLDWKRTIRGPGHDMRNIHRWLRGNMKYTLLRTQMQKFPQRDDFPEWRIHSGSQGNARA